MRRKGKVRSWNEQKGFGFIQPIEGGREVFLHVTGLRNRKRIPAPGQFVSYTMSTDKQGRPCAIQALLPGDGVARKQNKDDVSGAFIIATVFIGVVMFLISVRELPMFILWTYLATSLISFFLYAADKRAAEGGKWRIPESNLHWLALVGGWPGALIAQQVLRHKTRKKSFRTAFWVVVLINCGALIWICAPQGTQLVQAWTSEVFGGGNTATIEWSR